MTYALSLAQQKIEEAKSAGCSRHIITSPITTPVSQLTGGSQMIGVSQYSTHIKKIDVRVSWGGYRRVNGSVHLVTFISDND